MTYTWVLGHKNYPYEKSGKCKSFPDFLLVKIERAKYMRNITELLSTCDSEVMTLFESLKTIVVEQTYVDKHGIMSKKIKVVKDRANSRILSKHFYVCDFGDLHKFARIYNSFLTEANKELDTAVKNLWILVDGPLVGEYGATKRLSQPPFMQVYKRKLIPNAHLGKHPYDMVAKGWENKLNISLLTDGIEEKVGSLFLFDPFKGISLPILLKATNLDYKIKVVNLSTLHAVKDRLLEALDENVMLVIVLDLFEIASLIPFIDREGLSAITDATYDQRSIQVPYEPEVNNVKDC